MPACSTDKGPDLVVWGGIGTHKAIFGDLLVFNMEAQTWRAVEVRPWPTLLLTANPVQVGGVCSMLCASCCTGAGDCT